MILIPEAPPVQNWYDTVPLNDIAKRGLRDVEELLRTAIGDWSLVAASKLDEAQALAGEYYDGWLAGRLGLTKAQAGKIHQMALQTQRDRVWLERAQKGETQQQIADTDGVARNTVSVGVQRALSPLSTGVDNGDNAVPDKRVKLTLEQRDEILARYEAGETQCSLADEYGVSQSAINKIIAARREARRARTQKTLLQTPLPSAPSSGNDVSGNGDLVTPPVALFLEEGHELHKLAAYHHKRFVEEMKHCFAAIDNATRRLDKIHNAVLDDFQANHRSMFLRWTVYELIWKKEMLQDLECTDFPEIERRLEAKAKLLSKKVKHAFHDLRFDRTKITIAK